jgi:predicted nucleotidyltransferase
MTRDELIAKLRETAPVLRGKGVTRLAIFGSRARGDAREDSDLDVLLDVEPDAKFSGLDLVAVERTIRQATGIPRRRKCADRWSRDLRSGSPMTLSKYSDHASDSA